MSETDIDPMSITDQTVRSEGWLAFSERPQNVQDIMQRMYRSDMRFGELSALFVDHTPGKRSGSLRMSIRPPEEVNTIAYADDAGTGPPLQVTSARGDRVKMYAPMVHAYTILGRNLSQRMPPLESLPLTMAQRVHDGTTLHGSVFDHGVTVIAGMFVHPASLITSTFFSDKTVALVNQTMVNGRSTWELEGHRVPASTPLRPLGDSWRMWVDIQTGMVLRLEYYSGSTMIGWGELRELQIDGQGNASAPPVLASPDWSIPEDAQYVRDSIAFSRMARH